MSQALPSGRARTQAAQREPREDAPEPPARWIRGIYLAGLVATAVPSILLLGWQVVAAFYTASSVGLALMLLFGWSGLLLPPAVATWRFVSVWRNPERLASEPGHPAAAALRALGLVLVGLGVLAAIALVFTGPITRSLLDDQVGDGGVAYFVLGFGFHLAAALAPLGLIVFEVGRLVARVADRLSLTVRRLVLALSLAALASVAAAGHQSWSKFMDRRSQLQQ